MAKEFVDREELRDILMAVENMKLDRDKGKKVLIYISTLFPMVLVFATVIAAFTMAQANINSARASAEEAKAIAKAAADRTQENSINIASITARLDYIYTEIRGISNFIRQLEISNESNKKTQDQGA
jgi:flagellar basal body-associated protein FliL